MTYENLRDEPVSNSKFHMIRCLIAMALADGVICDEERAYITALTRRLNLTEEQKNTLKSDMTTPQDVGDLFRHINDPRYRGQAVYFARLMAFKDGVMEPSEQDLLNRLHSMATDGLDIETIRADAKKAVALDMSQHDINVDKLKPQGGLFGLFDEMMLKIGIDLMRD